MIAPRALGVVESTVVDDEKTVTFATKITAIVASRDITFRDNNGKVQFVALLGK